MEHYQFTQKPLGHQDLVEIRIVIPNPRAVAENCVGVEARKRIARWSLSFAIGLAASCGLDLSKTLNAVLTTLNAAVDQDMWRQRVLDLIRQRPISPRDLEETPPEGMSARDTRILAQSLVDDGSVMLDDELKYTVRIN